MCKGDPKFTLSTVTQTPDAAPARRARLVGHSVAFDAQQFLAALPAAAPPGR